MKQGFWGNNRMHLLSAKEHVILASGDGTALVRVTLALRSRLAWLLPRPWLEQCASYEPITFVLAHASVKLIDPRFKGLLRAAVLRELPRVGSAE